MKIAIARDVAYRSDNFCQNEAGSINQIDNVKITHGENTKSHIHEPGIFSLFPIFNGINHNIDSKIEQRAVNLFHEHDVYGISVMNLPDLPVFSM